VGKDGHRFANLMEDDKESTTEAKQEGGGKQNKSSGDSLDKRTAGEEMWGHR
jgi:hypothetical protein